MMAAVYETPVVALVDASRPSFEIYRGGIYSDPGCNATRLDHALQVVGYGTEKGQDYWICKNCWGNVFFFHAFILGLSILRAPST